MERPLNPRQLKFVERYLATGNATKSYAEAYGQKDPDIARVNAAQLLAKSNIKCVVDAHRAKASAKHGLTAEWYAERVKAEAEREGEGSSHGARVSALRLASELLGVGTPAPPPQDGLTFDAVVRIVAALTPRDPGPGSAGGGEEGVDEALV